MDYYHFVGPTLRDGRPVPADGEWLEHCGPLVPCKSGLHASSQPWDALQYAPGPILCLVELGGDCVAHGDPVDKVVARRRKIVRRIDATQLLRRFAADQALSVAHLWEMPQVVREYLTTLDESLRASARSASAAAWEAASARSARSASAREAWEAAWEAASARAAEAASASARSASASAAASEAASARSAEAAAWAEAWSAEEARWAAQQDFNSRVYSALGVNV